MIADATEHCEESAPCGGHGVCAEVRGHCHMKSSNETHTDAEPGCLKHWETTIQRWGKPLQEEAIACAKVLGLRWGKEGGVLCLKQPEK